MFSLTKGQIYRSWLSHILYLVYWFFRVDIPSISLDTPAILFSMPILFSEEPGIMITNVLYLVSCTNKLV